MPEYFERSGTGAKEDEPSRAEGSATVRVGQGAAAGATLEKIAMLLLDITADCRYPGLRRAKESQTATRIQSTAQ